MSIDLVASCLWLDLPPARKLVLLALCERANLETGACWPGRAEIAIRSSLSERRVSPHLKALERDGWLVNGPHPRRPGLTIVRRLNVDRIIGDGEIRRLEFKNRGGDDSSHTLDEEGTIRAIGGDVLGKGQDVSGRGGDDLGRGGDAVSPVTVKEPSTEPSKNLEEPVQQDFSFFDEWLKVKGQPHWDDPRKKSTIADAQRRAVVKRVQKLSAK